jgi:hypothetical protein
MLRLLPRRPDGAALTWDAPLYRTTLAYAVYFPLTGGGVAEWLKAAVC